MSLIPSPKNVKVFLKRLMDVVTVDYGELLTGFVMKENEGSKRKACLSLQASTYRILHTILFTGFTSECFTNMNFILFGVFFAIIF